MIRRLIVSILLGLAFAGSASAATWRVTADQEFQDIVDSAAYGDTVFVAPGQYVRVTMRSGIHLVAEQGPQETVIRNDRFWVVKADGVDSLAVVEGFTLDGIKAAEGVVYAENSQFTVRDCFIRGGWSGVRAMFSDITVQNCTITDCQNGVYFFESDGLISSNEFTKCINAISLVSASPRVLRNEIHGNSLGFSISKHSDPSIGGTLATSNRVWGNPGGGIKNTALQKKFELRTMKPKTLRVPFNYWGSDCPDSSEFRGPVEWSPWVDETGTRSIETCTPAASN